MRRGVSAGESGLAPVELVLEGPGQNGRVAHGRADLVVPAVVRPSIDRTDVLITSRAMQLALLEADVHGGTDDIADRIVVGLVASPRRLGDRDGGPRIVSFRLTPSANEQGLALALPEKVVMARPTGVGRAITAYAMPIEGRDEWLAAARRLA